MTITIIDLFCGGGGSSTGAIEVPGLEIRIAANHWDLAVEVAGNAVTPPAARDLLHPVAAALGGGL